MNTSHHADGPGITVLSGPGDLRAFGVRVHSANDNGLPATAIAAARGLVLSLEAGSNLEPVATIRLLAEDDTLLEPVHIAHESFEVVALWRGLGRDLGLPLYLRDSAGVMTPVMPVLGERVYPRAKGSPLSGRRPRFLARRRAPLKPFRDGKSASRARQR
jgi:hypothetical protein